VKIFLTIIVLLSLYSCSVPEQAEKQTENRYSNKFSVRDYERFAVLSIFNPWQQSQGVEINYVLSDDPGNIPDSLKDITFIKTPVSEVVVFSTTHIGFINALEETGSIKGVSGLNYSCDPLIRTASKKGLVYEVGTPPNINYERIIAINPDLVFLYGLETSVSGIRSRLENAGIPVVLIAEYLEKHPLGKMEWIKLFGWLYNKKELSRKIFQEASESYEFYKKKVTEIENKPSVLIGLPWKETWYMAGGNSFSAKLIEDAGGNYLWSENSSSEFIPLSLEAAL
jgi:iron complex transport system substrate-binding protein